MCFHSAYTIHAHKMREEMVWQHAELTIQNDSEKRRIGATILRSKTVLKKLGNSFPGGSSSSLVAMLFCIMHPRLCTARMHYNWCDNDLYL